jgi:hypothetical protein
MATMHKYFALPGSGAHDLKRKDANGQPMNVQGGKDGQEFLSSESDLVERFVNKFKYLGEVEVDENEEEIVAPSKKAPKEEKKVEPVEVEDEDGADKKDERKEIVLAKAKKAKRRVFKVNGKFVLTKEDGVTEVATFDSKSNLLKSLKG